MTTESTADCRILVVDDNRVNVRILQTMLRHCGLSCEIAVDGQEALEKTLDGSFDVILMDLHMPRMDGMTAMREIAERLSPHGPKVIAVTASTSSTQRQICMEAGFADFIPKPVRMEALRAVLAN